MRWTYNDILIARDRLSGVAVRTPLLQLHESSSIWIKPEVLQPIGSFKIRGAYNAIAARIQTGPLDEVTTLSAGNMSQAVAWSARRLGLRSTAIMPADAPEMKKSATRGYGASIETIARSEIMTAMQDGRFNDRPGFIHPFNDPLVAAGNGTIGLEILEDLPDVDTVIVPVGGGSGVCGTAIVFKAMRPQTRIIAVQTENMPAVYESFHQRKLVALEGGSTFAEGLATRVAFEAPFRIMQQLVDDVVLVSEEEMRQAMVLLLDKAHLVAEGAGASSLAAAQKMAGDLHGQKVGLIVSGGNVTLDTLRRAMVDEQPW